MLTDKRKGAKEVMTIKEELVQQFECAINATFGDMGEEEFDISKVSKSDITNIADKVCFYLDK